MIHLARLVAVFVAALAWATIAVVLGDWSGILSPATTVSAETTALPDDPCSLRTFLPPGTDARCEFPLARAGQGPLSVELLQTWETAAQPVLIQRLSVRDPSAKAPLLALEWRSAGVTLTGRLLRLTPVPASAGGEHLLWMVGNCAFTACGAGDLTIAQWDGAHEEDLLHRRVGTLAEILVDERGITVFDGAGRGVGAAFSPRMTHRFAFIGGVYVQLSSDPVPTIPPP